MYHVKLNSSNMDNSLFIYLYHGNSYKSCLLFWAPSYRTDIKLLDSVQRRVRRMLKSQEGMLYEEWLR